MRILLGWLAIAIATTPLQSQTRRDSIPPPIADHHAHLKRPAVARLWFVRYPPVELPADLDRILRDFALHWRERDHTAMVQLFTEDGIMKFGDAWRRGRGSLRVAFLDAMSGSDLRLWAQHYDMGDSLAFIAGSYGHRTRADRADIGRLPVSFDRVPAWRAYKGPVLGIFGELDAQTPVAGVVPRFTQALLSRKGADFTVTVFPNASHLLLEATRASDDELPNLHRCLLVAARRAAKPKNALSHSLWPPSQSRHS